MFYDFIVYMVGSVSATLPIVMYTVFTTFVVPLVLCSSNEHLTI